MLVLVKLYEAIEKRVSLTKDDDTYTALRAVRRYDPPYAKRFEPSHTGILQKMLLYEIKFK